MNASVTDAGEPDAGTSIYGRQILFLAGLVLLVWWNYWIPTARTYYSEVNTYAGRPNWDFFSYHVAGRAFDQGLNPYRDNSAHDASLRDLRRDGYSRFIYPPVTLPVFRALGRLDYDKARLSWATFYLAVYLASIGYLAVNVARRLRPVMLTIAALLLVTWHPLLIHLRFGQMDAVNAALITLSFVWHAQNRMTLSAGALALAAAIKVNPGLLLIYFVLYHRDWKYLLRFTACFLAVTAASLLVVPASLYVEYVTSVLPDISRSSYGIRNQSLYKFIGTSYGLTRVLPLVAFSAFGMLAWKLGARRGDPARQAVVGCRTTVRSCSLFLLNLLLILLLSPLCWIMAYVWVLPAIALLLAWAYLNGPPRVTAVLLIGTGLMGGMAHNPPPTNSINLLGNLVTTATLLWCLTRGLLWQRKQSSKRASAVSDRSNVAA